MPDACKYSLYKVLFLPKNLHYIKMLDQWDLDDVLQNLKEDELSLQQGVSGESAKIHAGK